MWISGALLAGLVSWCTAARAQRSDCLHAHANSQQLRLQGALLAAREQLLRCAQSECPKLVSNECTTWLAEVDAALSTVVFAVTDARGEDVVDVRVWSDGELLSERADGRAQTLDPGMHTFRFEASGFAVRVLALPIRQSERNRIVRVRLERVAPSMSAAALPAGAAPTDAGATPSPRRADAAEPASIPVASYVLAGVAVAGFGTFAGFALYGADQYDDAKQLCAPACSPDQVAAGRRAYVIADVGLGIGIASAAAAWIVYLVAPGGDATESDRRTGLQAGRLAGGGYLRWTAAY